MPKPDKIFPRILSYSSDFSTSYSKYKTSGSLVWTCKMYSFLPPAIWTFRLYPFTHLKKLNAGRYRNKQKFRCRNQSGSGIRGPSPVPDCSCIRLSCRMLECRCRWYRNKQKFRCRNQSGSGIRGPSPVPDCSCIRLSCRMLECRCRWHRPRCCPGMAISLR
jgi:hypothetical protein